MFIEVHNKVFNSLYIYGLVEKNKIHFIAFRLLCRFMAILNNHKMTNTFIVEKNFNKKD